jgi:hypothetical protein
VSKRAPKQDEIELDWRALRRATQEHERNKRLVNSGETFRGRQDTGWRIKPKRQRETFR